MNKLITTQGQTVHWSKVFGQIRKEQTNKPKSCELYKQINRQQNEQTVKKRKSAIYGTGTLKQFFRLRLVLLSFCPNQRKSYSRDWICDWLTGQRTNKFIVELQVSKLLHPVVSISEVRAEGDPGQGSQLHRQKMPPQGNHAFSTVAFLPTVRSKFSFVQPKLTS